MTHVTPTLTKHQSTVYSDGFNMASEKDVPLGSEQNYIYY